MSKIVILGAGHVGSICALSIANLGICDEIVLIDINRERAVAQAKDIADGTCFTHRHVHVHAGDYSELDDADILVNAVGMSRKPGQTRMDLLDATAVIMDNVIENMKQTTFDGIIISISNPCDVIANYLRVKYHYPATKIFGTGTMLDSARLKRTISELANIDMKSITCFAMGEHGESSSIPMSQIRIVGKALTELIEENPERFGRITLDELLSRTHQMGTEIIVGKGSTEFGIGMALADLCKAILYDEHRVLPVSALLNGEYGQSDIMAGVPAIIGRNGIEQIIEYPITDEEMATFGASCDKIRKYIEKSLE